MTTGLSIRSVVQRSRTTSVLTLLTLSLCVLAASDASAYTCRYRSSAPNGLAGKTISGGSASIQVPVQNTAETGSVNVIDLASYIECRNDQPNIYSDYMDMEKANTVLSNNFDVKVLARSREYNVPFSGKANVLSLLKNGSGAYSPIPLKIYYNMKEIPGERVAIAKGQTIGSIQAHKYSVPAGGAPTFIWNFVAANDTIVTSGGCAINDGNQIEIDFGTVIQKQLSSSTATRSVSRYIPYKCHSGSVTMGIRMSLVADRTTFSNDLIKTTNSAIGIKTMRGEDQLLPMSGSIRSSINQGIGGDTFTFSLLKQEGATPATGNFTGSATLIMSAD